MHNIHYTTQRLFQHVTFTTTKSKTLVYLLKAWATTYTTLHLFIGLFSRTTWVSGYQEGKTSLDLNNARDGVLRCSGISWTICKQSAPRSRQITTPTPHHSIFTGRMLFLTSSQQVLMAVNDLINAKSEVMLNFSFKQNSKCK